jgi:hypothetical protein
MNSLKNNKYTILKISKIINIRIAKAYNPLSKGFKLLIFTFQTN